MTMQLRFCYKVEPMLTNTFNMENIREEVQLNYCMFISCCSLYTL